MQQPVVGHHATGLACGTPSRFTHSPHTLPRRTYAQCTTGLARARLPVGESAPAIRYRNGSNNGVHKDTAIVARNGNGAHNDPAIIGGHELLWDGLPPAVTNALGQPIDPALVSQRKGRGGRVFDYLEGHAVIDQANRIFGYGGWGYELLGGAPRNAA